MSVLFTDQCDQSRCRSASMKAQPVSSPCVWRPSGTRGTWQRRWEDWYSCWWTWVRLRNGTTSPSVVNGVDKEEDLTHRPACEESAADHQWRHQSVSSCLVQVWTRHIRL